MNLENVLKKCCYWQRVKIVNTSLNSSEKIYEGSVQDFFTGAEYEYIDYKYFDYDVDRLVSRDNKMLILIEESKNNVD